MTNELQASSLKSWKKFCLLEVAGWGQILEEALKSPYCQAPDQHNERKAIALSQPCLGKSSYHGSSLEFRLVLAPEEYCFDDPLHQLVQDETFRAGGGPESLSAEEPPRIGMEPVRGPAVRF